MDIFTLVNWSKLGGGGEGRGCVQACESNSEERKIIQRKKILKDLDMLPV